MTVVAEVVKYYLFIDYKGINTTCKDEFFSAQMW